MVAATTGDGAVSVELRLHRLYQDSHTHSWNGPDVVRKAAASRPPIDADRAAAIGSFMADMQCVERSSWDAFLRLACQLPTDEARMAATAQAADEANHFVSAREYLRGLGLDAPAPDQHLVQALACFTPESPALEIFFGLSLLFEEAISSMFRQLVRSKTDVVLAKVGLYYLRDEARHTYFASLYLPVLTESLDAHELEAHRTTGLGQMEALTAWLKARSSTFATIGIDTDAVLDDVLDGINSSATFCRPALVR